VENSLKQLGQDNLTVLESSGYASSTVIVVIIAAEINK
jgi:hypothetical protein